MSSLSFPSSRLSERAGAAPPIRALAGVPAWLAECALPFFLILYLGLEGGGYGVIARSEVGIVIWWLVLLGAAIGVLPRARIGVAAWSALALLTAFTIWTALGVGWSESSERSMEELGRLAMYAGVLAVGLTVPRGETVRRVVGAVAAAIGVLGTLALLSRLEPSAFPADQAAHFVSFAENRLNYPLGYWNGLAALMAVGIPLLLAATAYTRSIVGQALAAAAIPALALTAFLTLSRGGALEITVGLVALLVLAPRRAWLAASALAPAAGAALLIAATTQRDALENGLGTELATSQGDEMLAMVIAVCAGVAFLQAGVSILRRYELGPRVRLPRRSGTIAVAVAALAVAVALIAAIGSGAVSEAWDSFRSPEGTANSQTERFTAGSGEGRYQYWSASLEAAAEEPLTGTGPGTFEYWWAREGSREGFVANAHSLYFETLGESGIVGIVLVVAFVLLVLAVGVKRTLRAHESLRLPLAAALAACLAAAVAFGVDWVWDLAVLPAAFLLLGGALLISRAPARSGPAPAGLRIGLAVASLAAIAAIAVPLATADSIQESQAQARAADLDGALTEAREAGRVQPGAATPDLQEALVLEAQGDLPAAAAAAQRATRDEPTNWRTWVILSRIEAERGNGAGAVEAFRRARELNPRSPLFQ